MCGYIGFEKDAIAARELLEELGQDPQCDRLRNNPGTGPGASVDIITAQNGSTEINTAIWWLLLDPGTLKPSSYTSFNTRSDKLFQPGTAGYQPFRESRCIIPATYIIEGQGTKGQRRYHRIEPENSAFALGGLYRDWVNPQTGETVKSCSVITLPPHPQWQAIHPKSTPMMLPADNPELICQWLDPAVTDPRVFQSLLKPVFRDTLICTPILRPGDQQQSGIFVKLNQ